MRTNWSAQSNRMWNMLVLLRGKELPAPTLNRAAAGEEGRYVSSFSKRISECRARARTLGLDVVKCRDEWHAGQRHTAYMLTELACNADDTVIE